MYKLLNIETDMNGNFKDYNHDIGKNNYFKFNKWKSIKFYDVHNITPRV